MEKMRGAQKGRGWALALSSARGGPEGGDARDEGKQTDFLTWDEGEGGWRSGVDSTAISFQGRPGNKSSWYLNQGGHLQEGE